MGPANETLDKIVKIKTCVKPCVKGTFAQENGQNIFFKTKFYCLVCGCPLNKPFIYKTIGR